MRLAISNIAWNVEEDEIVAQLLGRYKIDAIDVVPGKYFLDPKNASDEDIKRVKNWWYDRGIELTGMQSLLFGTSGLNLFGTSDMQNAMLAHLTEVCRIGAGLGAVRLVFGSPKNRDRLGLAEQDATNVALAFFRRLGDIAANNGVCICLEPNPPCYGANFLTDSLETARFVRLLGHPAIRMQLDTGALTINGEDVAGVLEYSMQLIAHIHASEPNLLPLGDGETDHAKVFALIEQFLPEHLVTIEMLATKDEPHIFSIERALKVAIRHYQMNSTNTLL